jgi:hypothetical protein
MNFLPFEEIIPSLIEECEIEATTFNYVQAAAV